MQKKVLIICWGGKQQRSSMGTEISGGEEFTPSRCILPNGRKMFALAKCVYRTLQGMGTGHLQPNALIRCRDREHISFGYYFLPNKMNNEQSTGTETGAFNALITSGCRFFTQHNEQRKSRGTEMPLAQKCVDRVLQGGCCCLINAKE